MKSTIVLLALGVCAGTLAGCQTNDRGTYDRAISEGPVGRSAVVVVQERQPTYRDGRSAGRPYIAPGRDYRNDRGDSSRGRYDRVRDERDRCLGDRNYDPRRDRCNR